MIKDERGQIECDVYGEGPGILFVPGSCSTGAAWRPVIGAMCGGFRCITTSLLGYGRTAERRTAGSMSIDQEAETIEVVLLRQDGPVHLVGHSFGGLAAVAVALRKRVPLASLTVLEAPAAGILRACGEDGHYRAFTDMTAAYFAAHEAGDRDAIEIMIDFYGGSGTYASWPPRVRDYAVETTPVNIMDWATAADFRLGGDVLAAIDVPAVVSWGSVSHPAVQRANELLGQHIRGARSAVIEGAAHFMISTHPGEVAGMIVEHVRRAGG